MRSLTQIKSEEANLDLLVFLLFLFCLNDALMLLSLFETPTLDAAAGTPPLSVAFVLILWSFPEIHAALLQSVCPLLSACSQSEGVSHELF